MNKEGAEQKIKGVSNPVGHLYTLAQIRRVAQPIGGMNLHRGGRRRDELGARGL